MESAMTFIYMNNLRIFINISKKDFKFNILCYIVQSNINEYFREMLFFLE